MRLAGPMPAIFCTVLLIAVVAAGENSSRQRIQLQAHSHSKCKYFRKGTVSECDPVTNTKSATFFLKKGENCPPTQVFHRPCETVDEAENDTSQDCQYSREGGWTDCGPGILTRKKVMNLLPGQPSTCPSTREKTVPCKSHRRNKVEKLKKPRGCKYSRKAEWTSCGSGQQTRSKVMKLLPDQPTTCPPTHTKTVPCRSSKDKTSKNGKLGKMKKRGKVIEACKYNKGTWSECEASTNTRTRELTLKKGDPSVCLPKKTITKKCKKPCKYTKGPWSPCNEATSQIQRQLTLQKGDPGVCKDTMTLTRPCHRLGAFTAAQTSECRYKPSDWTQCDTLTNTITRVLTLKSGDPDLCQRTKQLTRKCPKPCKFSKGQWSECDQSTNIKTRTDRLLKGNPLECKTTRVLTKKCGQDSDCKYEIGNWGDCNATTKARIRVKRLLSGDPAKCDKEISISRPCQKANGEESCFLGPWGNYGPCMNGVMMKHRPVIAGGVECERKAVKAKPCS